MTDKKTQRVRDRLVLIGGDHFKRAVDALDADAPAAVVASTIIDIVDGDPERLIDIDGVMAKTGIKSRETVYRYMKTEGFPKSVKLGRGRRGAARWYLGEVLTWARWTLAVDHQTGLRPCAARQIPERTFRHGLRCHHGDVPGGP